LQLAVNGENYSLLAANIFLVLLSIVLAYQKTKNFTLYRQSSQKIYTLT